MKKPLSDKELKFINEYLIDMNATRAAREAGFDKNPSDKGYRLLKKADIKKKIDEELAERREITQVDGYYIIEKIKEILDADLVSYLYELQLEDIEQMPPEIRKMVKSINVITNTQLNQTTYKVKFMCKDNALNLMAKHLGLDKGATFKTSTDPETGKPCLIINMGNDG